MTNIFFDLGNCFINSFLTQIMYFGDKSSSIEELYWFYNFDKYMISS